MSKKPKVLKKFQEDNDDQYEEGEVSDYQDMPQQKQKKSLSSSSSSSSQDEGINQQDAQYPTLQNLLAKLNDDDHSEDEGIEDYKTGGYHPCHIGQVLSNRYVLIQKLGWGHFSTVWLAKDFKYSTYVAIKIMKSSPHYLQASYDQIQILQKVAKNAFNSEWIKSMRDYQKDKTKYDRDDCHVLNLLNAFLYKGPYGNHFCMVFQILGVNLWEILKKYDCKGLPINIVKEITRQVLMGLDFLNRICKVIHTDLKPQNVLVCLTESELKNIVENSQLSNQQQFNERLNFYCDKYQLGPKLQDQEQFEDSSSNQSLESDTEGIYESQISTIQSKIAQLHYKLQSEDITKNCKKTLRKKLKKYQEEKEKELELKILHEKEKKEKKQQQKLQRQQKPKIMKHKTAHQLFVNFKRKISFDNTEGGLAQGFKVKIADLGNACWQHHHFATQIQTRQYRSPEVLLGSKYNVSADIWSLACMTFELLTGELLFNPKKDPNDKFGKNDDHLAQIMELLGRFPKNMSIRGEKGRKYVNKEGCLNRIPRLQNWSMKDVMIAKYRFKQEQAELFESFMVPMLNCYPEKRQLARDILNHKWLYEPCLQQYLMDEQTHQQLRRQKYDVTEERDQFYQYQSQKEDGSEQDNQNDEDQEDLYETQKIGEIKLIDRSFTDLGYIGYGTGIYLQKLDFGPNWQFS